MRMALGQFNATVGDIKNNVETMRRLCAEAAGADADVVVFPEMSICGYPPEDLLLKNSFLNDNRLAVEKLAKDCSGKTVIVGFAEKNEKGYFNSLAVLERGGIKKIYRKSILPNYGVFDERRYFRPGAEPVVVDVGGIAVALTICEDIWQLEWMDKFLSQTRHRDIIVNISASPFHLGKIAQREEMLNRCARHFNCAIAYCNLVGGQDELVFDGRSMFLDSTGTVVAQAKAFAEDLLVADISLTGSRQVQIGIVKAPGRHPAGEPMSPVAEVYEAIVLGTRDYVLKNGFQKVIIGLSGGIDSSLTAVIAAEALGAENVVGITMPTEFNSGETIKDAEKTAKNLGIEFHTIPITTVLDKFNEAFGTFDGWTDSGIAYENLQARIRGTILMSLSNRFSYLVLTTGNKSEIAVGYSTLYGDTAGGFAVIKDVPKTMVYQLAEYVNEVRHRQVIPASVITRAPSAELREDQKDTDSLPPYDLLDRILKGYVEEEKSAQELVDAGLPQEVVSRVIGMVDRNEYKRRQSPPGVKITPRAFGKDRRMPITNHYDSRGFEQMKL